MKTSGLGRGMSALFGDDMTIETEINKTFIHNLPITLIDVNKAQPRKDFNEERIKELAASIKENGMIQPITVCKNGERYEIVAGERRYRACRTLGMKEIPAIVKELTPRQVMELALIENLQREDLNPMEEASALSVLMNEYSLTQQQLSEKLGISRPALANSLRLLKLPPSVRQMLLLEKLTAGHGKALASIEDAAKLEALAAICVEQGLSVRETEKRVAALLNEKPKPKKRVRAVEFDSAEEQLRMSLGTKVKISGSEKKGKIEINYFSRDDLERLLELLSK